LGCHGRFHFFHHRDPELKWTLAANGLPGDGMWKSTPLLADFNGDGFLDLAALPRLGNGAHVWLGNGKGTWRDASDGLALPLSCGGGVAVGDINKDGHLDLAVADHCAGVFVYLGDGRGHWKVSTQALNPAAAHKPVPEGLENELVGAEDVAVGDVNEDGFLDLVVSSRMEGGITVYLGDGSGQSWREAISDDLPKSGWANKILLRDIDGDGHLDVIASYYEGPRVWHGDGKGHWRPYSHGLPTSSAGGLYRSLAVGDVNEDGRLDIVVANVNTGPEVYLQSRDGGWRSTPPMQSSIRAGAMAVALGDLNGDGHLDLVVGGSSSIRDDYGLFVFSGDGRAEWTELPQTDLPEKGLTFIWGLAIGDINRDGSPDLAVTTGGLAIKRPKGESLPRIQVWLNGFHRSHNL
jgi:hypothetical protein